MFYESKPRRRPLLLLGLLALTPACFLAGAEAKAQTFNATARVCLKYDDENGAPVEGASVKRTGGQNDYDLAADPKEKGCYVRENIPFLRGRTYSLEINPKRDGYEPSVLALDTAQLQAGGVAVPAPDGWIGLKKGGTLPAQKGVQVCVKDSDGAQVTNAKVVLVLNGTQERHELQQDTQVRYCYRDAEISLDDAKAYTLTIRAAGYGGKDMPLDRAAVQAVQRGVGIEAALEKQVVSWWRTGLLIAAIVVPLLAVLWWLLRWRKRHSDAEPRIVNLTQRPEPGRDAAVAAPLDAAIQSLAVPLEGIRAQLESHTRLLEKIVGLLDGLRQEAIEDEGRRAKEKEAADKELRPPQAFVKNQTAAPEPDGEALARSFYANFLRGDRVTPEPIFLSAEGGSSMMDMLGSKPAVLEPNPQGALVMFRRADGAEGGWVYPNTQLYYREEALRKVFPRLKEEQFNSLKENKSPEGSGVEPVQVKRLDGSRWQVATR